MKMPGIRECLVVFLCGAMLTAVGCSSATATSAKPTIATVQRGSLSVAVTGTGNLALSTSQNAAFQIAGYVAEVLVKEGESVKKGQALAKLDTSEWDKQVKKLDSALVTAQRTLDSKQRALAKAQDQVTSKDNAIIKAQRAVTSAESAIAKAQRLVTTKEMAVRQAELDLQTSQDSLDQITDVKAAQDDIDEAQDRIDFVKLVLRGAGGLVISDPTYWLDQQIQANKDLETAQQELADILAGTSTRVTSDVALQVKKAQLQAEQSQRALDEAKIAVDDAKFAVGGAQLDKSEADLAVRDAINNKADAEQAVADAQTAVDDAKQDVTDAQADLDEARNLSPIVTAPFDGFIPKINVKGGDEVFKGTVAMQVADPTQFEAVILVSEKNISSLQVGQIATVFLDAMSGATFPAQIAKIAALATASQGVVNYQVTVKLTSTQPRGTGLGQAQQSGSVATSPQRSSGTGQTPSGRTTTAPSASSGNTTASNRIGSATPGAANANTSQAVTLKSGLSAVVTIVIQQKDNVLKVPSRAITRQGQNYTVQVVTSDGTEARIVKTGMSDNSNTEITEGLSEGEQIEIKAATTTTPSSGNRGGPSMGGIRLP